MFNMGNYNTLICGTLIKYQGYNKYNIILLDYQMLAHDKAVAIMCSNAIRSKEWLSTVFVLPSSYADYCIQLVLSRQC